MRRLREVSSTCEDGFTLLELLVSLTLFAILMTALFGGLGLGTRVWEASDGGLEASDQLTAVHGFLHQRLEEALPVSEIGSDGPDRPLFSGEPERLQLASFMPASLGEGIFLLELTLRRRPEDDETRDLVLRWRPWPELPTRDISERVILDRVAGIRMSYFGRDDRGSTASWQDRWLNQSLLPSLIRVELQFPSGDRRQWRPLIVSPIVDEWYDTSY